MSPHGILQCNFQFPKCWSLSNFPATAAAGAAAAAAKATLTMKSKQTIFNFPNCAIFQLPLRSDYERTYFHFVCTFIHTYIYYMYVCVFVCTFVYLLSLHHYKYAPNAMKSRFTTATTRLLLLVFYISFFQPLSVLNRKNCNGNCCIIFAVVARHTAKHATTKKLRYQVQHFG